MQARTGRRGAGAAASIQDHRRGARRSGLAIDAHLLCDQSGFRRLRHRAHWARQCMRLHTDIRPHRGQGCGNATIGNTTSLNRSNPVMNKTLRTDFDHLQCAGDFWSLRLVDESAESYAVRKNVQQPPASSRDRGAMLTVWADGGSGYAATSDLSGPGLQAALDRATQWARATAAASLIDFRTLSKPAPHGDYASPDIEAPGWSSRDWYELLGAESRAADCDPRIVDWEASVETRNAVHVYLTSTGGDVTQRYRFVMPNLTVTAHADGDTQTRSLNGYRGLAQQGGEAMLQKFGFAGSGARI